MTRVGTRAGRLQRRLLIKGTFACGLVAIGSKASASLASIEPGGHNGFIPPSQFKVIANVLQLSGEPQGEAEARRVLALMELPNTDGAVELAAILERYTLMSVQMDLQGVGRALVGGSSLPLFELGWRSFLVRVENPARLRGALMLVSPAAIADGDLVASIHDSHVLGNDTGEIVRTDPDLVADFDSDLSQWIGYRFGVAGLLGLEGFPVEYQVLQLYSQANGRNIARLSVCVAGVPPVRRVECKGFDKQFECSPASSIGLSIRDWDGAGTVASLVICDDAGRLYPPPGHRIEPDLGYQTQIYRADGESLHLAAGSYRIIASRGSEYLETRCNLLVPKGGELTRVVLNLERWINPPQLGWYPGDPHLHPEGQVFGIVSKLGLTPETMLRQVRGEALTVGSVLIWTGGYYYEKQFLTGHVYEPSGQLPFPQEQEVNNVSWTPQRTPHDTDSVLRYDVEQAAFPSNRFGHPVLLRLLNHDYPGVRSVWDWPSWNLPVLQWAKAQGAVVGYAHCGYGMAVNSTDLPNYEIPALDGLGANECLVDVTHGAVDFIAGGEVQPISELNVWYHLLNCGFVIPMVGETDFPRGARGRRVGAVRTYVGLDSIPKGDQGYNSWTESIKAGRVYFGDGRSHVIDFRANHLPLGKGPLDLPEPGHVILSARVAARLEEVPADPTGDPRNQSYAYWHLERARLGSSRNVPLEVIVNGKAVAQREVLADGKLRTVSIKVNVRHSSWIALRILSSVHTAPIIVSVADRPVRASRRSAQWCLDCVDVLWREHAKRIRPSEFAAAAAAWEHARATYRQTKSECTFE